MLGHSLLDAGAKRTVARDHQVRVGAVTPQRIEHVDRELGLLLRHEVTDEADERDASSVDVELRVKAR